MKLLRLLWSLLFVWLALSVFPVLAQDSSFNQAPQLAELVENGELPVADERLPANPLLIIPSDSVGNYGGTWRTTLRGERDHFWLIRTLGYENLVRWDPRLTRVIPNIAQTFEGNENATEFTFKLREGMRWSDGEPFTVDDIMFWYNDVLLNPELTPAPLPWLISGGEPVMVEKVDDVTVKFSFAEPNGLFLQNLATVIGAEPTSYPRHYLEQFHITYNADANALAAERGFEDWAELFISEFGIPGNIDEVTRWQNPNLPTLHAWLLTGVYGEVDELVAVRNPYYWKIDTAFNQLPYIDRIVYTLVPDTEGIVERVLNGQVDMQDRHLATLENRPIFEENADAVGYDFFATLPTFSNNVVILFNLTHPDPALREIFQNKDFRIALSHAVDRQTIIDEVYDGRGRPYQAAPRPESPFFDEQLATQFTEFDPGLANEILDNAGFDQRDDDGIRLAPDGTRLEFEFKVTDILSLSAPLVVNMVAEDWEAVGVRANVIETDRNDIIDSVLANAHDIVSWIGDGGIEILLEPRYYFPFNPQTSKYAPAWAYWRNDPSNPLAEEPPPEVQAQIDLYAALQATSNEDEQNEFMTQILEIAAEQFYAIGVTLPGDGYGIVRDEFFNVPPVMPFSGPVYPNPAPTNPSQFYIAESE